MAKETPFHDLIHDYDEQSKLWHHLTVEQQNELVSVWLQNDCPGVPASSTDYFDDAMVSNLELKSVVLDQMAGNNNLWFSLSKTLFWGIREHCASDVIEAWQEFTRHEEAA